MPILEQMAEGQANAHVVFNGVSETLEHQGVYGKAHLTTSGLTWGYVGGRWGGFSVAAGTFTLTASATNYLVVARATGVPTSSTTSTNWDNLTDYARVYKLTTNATAVTVPPEDHRSGPGGVHGGASMSGGAGDMVLASAQTVTGAKTFGAPGAVGKLVVAGTTSGTTIIDAAAVAGTTTVSLPGATGTLLSTAAPVTVAQGGSGVASLTAYAPVFGGTTSTGAVQSGTAGTAGQVLTSNGAGVLPSFQAAGVPSTTPVLIQMACSDEATALTAGVAKVTMRAPYAFTLTDVRASVTTAPTGGTLLTVDLNEAGTTVLSTKLTFNASEKTTTTAATPRVISDSAIADDAEITVDIDAVGSTIAGTGLKVTIIGTKP